MYTQYGLCCCWSYSLSSFLFRFYIIVAMSGDLAQLARASALQAEGQGFKSPNLQRRDEYIFFFYVEQFFDRDREWEREVDGTLAFTMRCV